METYIQFVEDLLNFIQKIIINLLKKLVKKVNIVKNENKKFKKVQGKVLTSKKYNSLINKGKIKFTNCKEIIPRNK